MVEWSLYQNRACGREYPDRPGQLVDPHPMQLDQLGRPAGFGDRFLRYFDPQIVQQHLDNRRPTVRFADLGKAGVVEVDGVV